ncbi:ATP-dependent zinc metalloprotease FtsH [Corynebacterium kalinowskii]|uniref:ATP-dependent zinc metalloprotease FtsH n=1 Tax=Corynebacterium kalinowskii TaxID=2675216 RepID=A0A6B8VI60_9CORY|nr:ATP-dependent zinc metalloprotease FtsH [Corynebacterium kalinowskii]QGU01254.1 ATP-dependent zinc metalloprotease FtsH [Corynebacterium kalinowskii]
MDNKKILRYGAIAAIILIAMFSMTLLTSDSRGFQKVDTSIALQQLDNKNVKEARIDDREQRVRLELKEPIKVEEREGVSKVITDYPARTAPTIFDKVAQSEAEKYNTKVTRDTFLGSMVQLLLPMLLFFGLIMFVMTRMQGGGMGMFGFGGSRAKELTKDMPTNTFADVAGADEAVDELQEIKDFLQDPSRYEALGAKIPRGVLLYGPPGTGKTLLARAVAGEAGVPFYSISGSDFVEMFVGVGASRVRDLFKQAKENSPCIIFVDEIDAVGRQRGAGMGGGHDEREQTLNQLLVEMDGFGDREGVILMAATNRPDILDPALLRPGRFDRQIPVTNPDFKGREAILQVHAKGKPFAKDVDITALAKRTAGMSGADLANVLNEAALLTARVGGNVITADALEEATDRVIGGPRRSSKVISEHEKKVTAYHEGGHTLAAWGMKNIESIYKVTILARGKTGGFAMTAQEDDKGMYTRDELFARIVFAMGGRSAEELVFGAPTTGASNDIEQATRIARAMITEYGMSPEIGTVKYGEEQGDPFSGRGGGGVFDPSESVQSTIDEQTRYLVNKAHQVAYDILRENRHYLDSLAEKLLEKETLRRPDLEVIFEGLEPRDALEVFPGETANFPRQVGLEPVKTPVEIAIERGEEPPKRFSILEASRAARAKRQKELEEQGKLPIPPMPPVAPIPAGDAGRHAAPEGPAPTYGGTPPPADWSAPGWPPRDSANNPYAQPSQPEQPAQPEAPQAPARPVGGPDQTELPTRAENPESPANSASPFSTTGEHPGMQNYAADAPSTPVRPQPSEAPTEEFGFRLPDNEQPDHPEKSESEERKDD